MKTVLAALLLATLASAQDQMADVLRKGILAEESNHDINAAIQAYQSVVQRYDDGRKTAATALFRLAECYRKQGKNEQASVTYRRVLQEFGDLTNLAEQSRRRLPVVPAKSAQSKEVAEARQRYRAALEEGIKAANMMLGFVEKQLSLGAISEVDALAPRHEVVVLQSELAAFDAGMVPERAAGPDTPVTAEARRRYKSLLEQDLDYANKEYKAAVKKYELGTSDNSELESTQRKVLRAKLQLAALEGGLAPLPLR